MGELRCLSDALQSAADALRVAAEAARRETEGAGHAHSGDEGCRDHDEHSGRPHHHHHQHHHHHRHHCCGCCDRPCCCHEAAEGHEDCGEHHAEECCERHAEDCREHHAEESCEHHAEHHCEREACSSPTPAPPYPPYPPPPAYPPMPPYPPFPPYPPYIVIAPGSGCGCGCHGTQGTSGFAPAQAMPGGAATASSPAQGSTAPQAPSNLAARPMARVSAVGVGSSFPDPSTITDIAALLDLGEKAAEMAKKMVPAEMKPEG
jgi:hypothetical protein